MNGMACPLRTAIPARVVSKRWCKAFRRSLSQELASRFGAKLKVDAVPFLTVLDATGKPSANQSAMSLPIETVAATDAGKGGLTESLVANRKAREKK